MSYSGRLIAVRKRGLRTRECRQQHSLIISKSALQFCFSIRFPWLETHVRTAEGRELGTFYQPYLFASRKPIHSFPSSGSCILQTGPFNENLLTLNEFFQRSVDPRLRGRYSETSRHIRIISHLHQVTPCQVLNKRI